MGQTEACVLLPDGRAPFSFSRPPFQLTGGPQAVPSTPWETEYPLTS